ncbi:MAG: site-specific DNA-methyltransferase, partial [Candidatus Shapirobacteria bacterium]|nr:site-specific DNA-methyltransferase [Candidatus Shapirobacteria bacterium]
HAVLGRMDYLIQHELIAYGWFGTHKFYKSKDKTILFFPKPQKSKLHPTMKPIPLIRHLILNSSQIGDYVFDGFLGSGTTLLAAEQTRRKCLGIELDPEYCQTIVNRYQRMKKL